MGVDDKKSGLYSYPCWNIGRRNGKSTLIVSLNKPKNMQLDGRRHCRKPSAKAGSSIKGRTRVLVFLG